MAKGAYIGVGGVAKKIKKMYIGVGGVAKKVKKAYIGVGGVAKLFWSGSAEVSYYGTATALSVGRSQLAATSINGYALFAGGINSPSGQTVTTTNAVDAYNSSLTRTTPSSLLGTNKSRLAGASAGNIAVFEGGYGSSYSRTVDAYNTSLTRTYSQTTAITATCDHAGVSFGNYAVFGGGQNNSGTLQTGNANAFNSSLTRTALSDLRTGVYYLMSASIGNYALFAGGYNSGEKPFVTAYNGSFTRSYPTDLSISKHSGESATVGNYALFAGGYGSGGKTAVDTYNASLTRGSATELSVSMFNAPFAGTSVNGYAIFTGGNNPPIKTANAYDESLTRTIPSYMSITRSFHAAASIGNYALFAGGIDKSGTSAVRLSSVDVYQVA